MNGFLQFVSLPGRAHIFFAFMVNGASEESACAAGRVENRFVQFGVYPIYNKLGDGSGCVELARIARALQAF